jgi:predicted RNase H-like HicB family nuclease
MQTLTTTPSVTKQAHEYVASYNFCVFEDPLGDPREPFTAHVLEIPAFTQPGRTKEDALQRLRGLALAFVKRQLLEGVQPPRPLRLIAKSGLRAWVLIPERSWEDYLSNTPIPALVAGRSLDEARYMLLRAWGLPWTTNTRAYRQPHLDSLLQLPGVISDPLLRLRAGLA